MQLTDHTAQARENARSILKLKKRRPANPVDSSIESEANQFLQEDIVEEVDCLTYWTVCIYFTCTLVILTLDYTE